VRMSSADRARGNELIDKLKDVGRRAGWGNKAKPTVSEMAARAGFTEVYEFFYHAACSSVHASLHHLMRMVWVNGESENVSISNRNFEQYYRRFALIYGAWIASEVIAVIEEEFPASFPSEKEDCFSIWLAIVVKPAVVHRAPAIVTGQELNNA
jgi:hypothetical protein